MSDRLYESFVWYGSFYDTMINAEQIGKDVAYNFAKAVMEYGLYGEYDESDAVVNALMSQVLVNIDQAKSRYDKAKGDGKKGGRPEKYSTEQIQELLDQGLSRQEIIDKLGCSARTFDRKMKEIRDKTT